MPKSKSESKGKRRFGLIAAAGALIVIFIGIGAWSLHSAADTAGAARRQRLTLDPSLFGGRAHKAYEIARHDPALLAQLHCYCGCDKELGHRNLLDCYRSNHAAHCPICMGEAIDAQKMADEGLPVEQIRRALRDHYSHGD